MRLQSRYFRCEIKQIVKKKNKIDRIDPASSPLKKKRNGIRP
jgi:hypothetical protein